MKTLLVTTGSLISLAGFAFFLNCPMVICRTPEGYARWVAHETKAIGELAVLLYKHGFDG